MEIKKEKGRYYVNNLDLQELLSNRKYVMNYIKTKIEYLENIKGNKELWEPEYQVKLETLRTIQKKMKLRR